jgi:hypothetical protein
LDKIEELGVFDNWKEVVNNKNNKTYYPWIDAGLMKTGRWYPTLLPLQDGSMVYFSGFIG